MPSEISQLLVRWQKGDSSVLKELMPMVYEELRKLGRAHFRRKPEASLLQPTALVHEAWLRLGAKQQVPIHCRGEFFALASRIMRDVLIDHVRRQRALKRGGKEIEITLDGAAIGQQSRVLDFVVLNDALIRLTEMKPRCTQIVEMRFFGGLTTEEIAEALHVSTSTVEREWNFARLWLMRELGPRKKRDGCAK